MKPTPEEAQWALVEAGAARRLLAAKGRWPRAYLLAYAVGAAVTLMLAGLGGVWGVLIIAVAWPTVVIVMQRLSRSRAVTERGGRRAISTGAAIWGVLYVIALALGYAVFRGDPSYWVLAGVVVALPFVAVALRRRKES
jgi:uncharacterized RDD family membrane protein YckC